MIRTEPISVTVLYFMQYGQVFKNNKATQGGFYEVWMT